MSMRNQTATATAANNYAAVRKTIERGRLRPWASAAGVTIGSFVVAPLSFRSLVDLELADNAFVSGQEPIEGDIGVYIWRHMPEFTPSASPGDFIKQIAKAKNIDELVEGILDHLGTPFEETPAGVEFGGDSTDNRLPAIPSIAAICDEYGAAYGVDPQDVADIDLKIVFQCCRARRLRNGTKYLEHPKLRKAKSDFLKAHG